MSRAGRVRALITITGLGALLVAAVFAAGAAASTSSNHAVLIHCAKVLGGEVGATARSAPGSADPRVASEFSIFRVLRTSEDMLPSPSNLNEALGGAEATTYDPSASVRLNLGKAGMAYAVPATLAAPTVPASCTHSRELAGLRAVLALREEMTGTGPGVCVVTTQRIPVINPISTLPGKTRPGQRRQGRTIAVAGCESLDVMASYLGALGGALPAVGSQIALIPDGVSSVTYTLASGRQITAPVSGNILTAPAALSNSPNLHVTTRAKLGRQLAAIAPVTVTELGADGAPVASFPRPPALINQVVQEVFLLKRLIGVSTTSRSGSTSEAGTTSVSCSARTHRCVAVVITSTCSSAHRCRLTRTVHRYRYVTRRPPRGTTGPMVLPTGPVRARLDRYIRRPGGGRTLVLSGTPHRRVGVILGSSCVTRRGGAAQLGRPQRVRVPSRIPVHLPRHARSCNVDVLVTSTERGSIHARLVRG